ncbi:MAG TPA: NADH-ubiquinone oxidoreductase-F iron-sulfur binding region domain-containing protein [Dehalococcoidia bacterium]|nr:NADH-ubiquinone oxidoreductase-F iron-sulfur binding region domain-containing protein [Dehalococcoidia bacterium]
MATYDELRTKAEQSWAPIERPARPVIRVSLNTTSLAAKADRTLDAIRSEIAERKLAADVIVTGDTGFAWAEPVVQITSPAGATVLYGDVTPDRVEKLLAQGLDGVCRDLALCVMSGPDVPGVPRFEETEYGRIQARWLMRNCGVIDPENVWHYIARGGYGSFMKATELSPDDLIEVVKGSTLRGRSGSFFSTGMKWSFLQRAERRPKYLVCNADEGDPGAWVNRVLMESDPHSVLEGMLIGAYATGAEYGWIYIRDEYPLAVERMRKAIEQARELGIFGEDALGRGVRFDAEVVRGAGAYVCGEETGLINSVNDNRGMPTVRPPFPAERGVLLQPTNVNNVETYASVTCLLHVGPERYSQVGTEVNRGTKPFTLSGAVERPCVVEVPFGTPVRAVLEAAGGISGGRKMKALQAGGPLAGILPADVALDLALEPETFRAKKVQMGGGGLVFVDETACIVDLNIMFAWFLEDESCGRCTSCHGGTQRMLEIFRRIASGGGDPYDVTRAELVGKTLVYSNCVHGQAAPTIMLNTLEYFRDEFDEHLFHRRCPAKVCAGLVRYEVADPAADLQEAADLCPTDAFVREASGWRIDSARCIRCDACREVAPDAIAVVDAFAAVAAR